MNKYKIIQYIESLENEASQSNQYFIERNELYIKYQKQKEVLDKIRKNNKRIIDYGFDYDGFNKEEDLKKLIDMLVDYAKQNDKLLEEIR